MANFITTLRTRFLTDLYLGKTRIWIYTECAGMGINFPDIRHTIQFKMSDCIMLSKLFEQLKYKGRDVFCLAVAIVFVQIRQILSDDVHILEKSTFKYL